MSNAARKARLQLEVLEDRTLPSCNVIGGFVYVDANNNGLFDAGETPVVGSALELRNAANLVIDTAVSDSTGYYEFDSDSTIPLSAVETHTLQFGSVKTNTLQTQNLPKFNPAQGQLDWVEITINGSLTSVIAAENLDDHAVTIVGNVAGSLNVAGPRFSSVVTTSTNADSFNAQAWDGDLDFGGTSGITFSPKTVPGQQHLELRGFFDVFAYTGTGSVALTAVAQANSSASGGGNLVAQINSQGEATVTVVYHYTPSPCLRPGSYSIVQTSQPAGYFDNKESTNGIVLPGSVGTDSIGVVLGTTSLEHNDFGEVPPARIKGIVYEDSNNNGLVDLGERSIVGATMTLTGVDDQGQPVTRTLLTAADGTFLFLNLRPGLYNLYETQPAGYLDGKDTVGTSGGLTRNDRFRQIPITPGAVARWYRFGELRPAALAGFVWVDTNDDGARGGEAGLAGVVVTLSGIDDLGSAVSLQTTTASDGSYRFGNLRPGMYTLSETQPLTHRDGKDALGTMGGTKTNDRFANIAALPGIDGVEYNFGELPPVTVGSQAGNGGKKSLIDFLNRK